MTETLKHQIETRLFRNGRYDGNLWKKIENKFLKQQMIDVNPSLHYSQNVYHILYDMDEIPKCYCGRDVRFIKTLFTYSHSCCFSHARNNPKTLEKRVNTNLERYGVENVSSTEEVKEKRKETNIERFGVSCNLHSEDGIKSKRETWRKRYGVENPSQNLEIFEKQVSKSRRLKSMILPSGAVIQYQGYENVAIQKLLQTHQECDIISRRNLPVIWYSFEDKHCRYFPDIFIPRDNLLIEVKSTWTFERDYERNQAKAGASRKLGYNFQFWICDNEKVISIL